MFGSNCRDIDSQCQNKPPYNLHLEIPTWRLISFSMIINNITRNTILITYQNYQRWPQELCTIFWMLAGLFNFSQLSIAYLRWMGPYLVILLFILKASKSKRRELILMRERREKTGSHPMTANIISLMRLVGCIEIVQVTNWLSLMSGASILFN